MMGAEANLRAAILRQGYMEAMEEAHAICRSIHDDAAAWHERIPPGLFGKPTKRHHELMGKVRAARSACDEILARMRKAATGQEGVS